MLWRHYPSVKNIGKNVLTAAIGQISVQARHFRQSATEDNDLRVENVDDSRQSAAKTPFVTLQRCFAGDVTGVSALLDCFRSQILPAVAVVVSGQRRAGEISFDAARSPAITGGLGKIFRP